VETFQEKREKKRKETILYPGEEKITLKKILFVYSGKKKILSKHNLVPRRGEDCTEEDSFVHSEREKILLKA